MGVNYDELLTVRQSFLVLATSRPLQQE